MVRPPYRFVQAVTNMGAAISAPLFLIGAKLGLYKAMAGAPALTSQDVAERAGAAERPIRHGGRKPMPLPRPVLAALLAAVTAGALFASAPAYAIVNGGPVHQGSALSGYMALIKKLGSPICSGTLINAR